MVPTEGQILMADLAGRAERFLMRQASAVMSRNMSVNKLKDSYGLWRVRVTAVVDVAPKVRRLTLQGDGLRTLELGGADEYFGLLMPPAGAELVMPEGRRLNLRPEIAKLPEATRPGLRWYSVRAHRPELGEVDVDIVIHAAGPGGEFLSRVQVGDEVGFREGSGIYAGIEPGERQLFVADETAFPALSAMADLVADSPAASGIHAVVEIPDAGFAAELEAPFEIEWLYRGDAAPGSLAVPHVREMSLPTLSYAWACGERELATGVRRNLVKERGVEKTRVLFSGYWRLGQARE